MLPNTTDGYWRRAVDTLQDRVVSLEAENRRLREALEGLAAQIDAQAVRAIQQNYHPSTPLRYAEMLRGFAYDLRAALDKETNDA